MLSKSERMDVTISNRLLDVIASLPKDLSKDESELLAFYFLIQSNKIEHLNGIFSRSEDKAALQSKIDACISVARGEGFAFTGHGITKTLSATFSVEKLERIGLFLDKLIKDLKNKFDIECFLTSGTLLGLVREGQIIAHDDDFDLAYVSSAQSRKDILEERKEVYRYLKSLPLKVKNQGKHFTILQESEDLTFWFDLFPAWVEEGMFNEVPLKPMTLPAEKVLPLASINFYGTELPAPRDPEAFLELNYGPGWRVPDPSFRFDFSAHADFYWFIEKDSRNGGYND